ncbi:hypothetical protein BO224_07190 [Erysipelotrichaceae bacterium NYU-BL-E8]|uniref:Uncharacterized protein n=1 Tax=Ileibacterium valens TaxID=1862668 RepID=A0A1U7NFT5_9FIRM|nr:hypothetical protein BM735_12780 [Erysipelotrichaceae bacterium NYU-BL-F16]OLU39444.1 hypothetical protein BO222_06655 [Ileibacterium valens]OLU39508.1 hypothetical protein BO224_07190 [Erysipelotrichaceae bacterium NYU-BL-E8]
MILDPDSISKMISIFWLNHHLFEYFHSFKTVRSPLFHALFKNIIPEAALIFIKFIKPEGQIL